MQPLHARTDPEIIAFRVDTLEKQLTTMGTFVSQNQKDIRDLQETVRDLKNEIKYWVIIGSLVGALIGGSGSGLVVDVLKRFVVGG